MAGQGQQIDLAQLSAQQLSQVKKQLDDEVQHLTNSYQNLRTAQQKFRDCIVSIKNGVASSAEGMPPRSTLSSRSSLPAIRSLAADLDHAQCLTSDLAKPLLVPLTSSLYVPGTLADTEKVLVDVGTGFYVEKDVASAQKFYEGKIEELGKNIKELENIVNSKANNLRVVEEVLRQNVLAGGQQPRQAAAGA
ncbi:unnamed protein product [Cercospora beticola]|nr:unnamed protein product [Cercospora beticola]